MARISRLPQPVAGRLRSSCILSSFAQVLEELVCNSIDAQATEVQVQLDVKGSYIKVEDNGYGINRDDFTLLGERHATSKLHCLDELEAGPSTLGFRGEGLSSISDIGLVEVTSRARGCPHTYRKIFKNCKTLSLGLTDIRSDAGTSVVVRDVFYNQPVRRRQFQDSSRKVLELVKEHILRLAIIHPKTRFNLVDLERQEILFHTSAFGSTSLRIRDLFGAEIYDSLQKIDFAKAAYRLSGYMSKQPLRSKKAFQYLYINRRFVHKTPLHKLLNSWQRELTMQSEGVSSPTFILNLGCPPADYDITLDASKTIVEFKDWSSILSFGEAVLKEVWGLEGGGKTGCRSTGIPSYKKRRRPGPADCVEADTENSLLNFTAKEVAGRTNAQVRKGKGTQRSSSAPPFYKPRRRFDLSETYNAMKSSDDSVIDYQARSENKVLITADNKIYKWRQSPLEPGRKLHPCVERPILKVGDGRLAGLSLVPDSISRETLLGTRVLGQVDKKFIAAVANGTLVFIDQHAADERIRLEEFRDAVLSSREGHSNFLGDASQELSLSQPEKEILTTYRGKVEYWGWRWSSISNRTSHSSTEICKIILTSVPCIMGVKLSSKDLLEYLHQLADTQGSSAPPSAVLRVLNFKACRGAIMFGDVLLPSECQQLVDALKKASLCFQCAHGRPTMAPIVDLKALRKHCEQSATTASATFKNNKLVLCTKNLHDTRFHTGA